MVHMGVSPRSNLPSLSLMSSIQSPRLVLTCPNPFPHLKLGAVYKALSNSAAGVTGMEKKESNSSKRLLLAPPAKAERKRKSATEKAETKRRCDKLRAQSRVNIGSSFDRWRKLRQDMGLKTDADTAEYLLNSYEKHSKGPCLSIHTTVVRNVQPPPPPPPLSSNGTESQSTLQTCSENRPKSPKLERRDSTEMSDSMFFESPSSSSNEDKQDTCAVPFVCSSENGNAPGKKDAAPQRAGGQDKQLIIKQSQNKVNRDIQEGEEEEFSTTLSVGDGRYLVDLGSSSEFIVDEECILQLFKLCRECNKQCSVRKRVQGLKIVVHQTCCFCQSRFTWTNLPDADEDDGRQVEGDFQINGQTNTAASPSSNTS